MRLAVGQVIIGLTLMIAIGVMTPFMEIMELFFWIVCIPLLFFTGLGLVTEGTIYSVHAFLTGFFLADLRKSIQKWRDYFRETDQDARVFDQ